MEPDRRLQITEVAALGILNGPDWDRLPATTQDQLHVQFQFSLDKNPAAYSRFVALNWNYAPGRPIYQLPPQLVPLGARQLNPYVRILERLRPDEVDLILRKDVRIKAEYDKIIVPFWQYKLNVDFPTRSKQTRGTPTWVRTLFDRMPKQLYTELLRPARQFTLNVGPRFNPWEREEFMEAIENFLLGVEPAVKRMADGYDAFPALAGDVVWFSKQGVWALWNGAGLDMPSDYGEDEAHLSDWIAFPEYPLDHYRDLNPRQDLRGMVRFNRDYIFKPRPGDPIFPPVVAYPPEPVVIPPQQGLSPDDFDFDIQVMDARAVWAPRVLSDKVVVDEGSRSIKVVNFFGEEFTIMVGLHGQGTVTNALTRNGGISSPEVYWDANRRVGSIEIF